MTYYLIRKRSSTSNVFRVKLRDTSSSTGASLTGLTSASTGLSISTICDNESSATTYTVAGSTIESITTLGTYAAPTATKCRFKEVDATNHPGLYEIQIADARFAVSNSRELRVTIKGATNLFDTEVIIQLTSFDVDTASVTVGTNNDKTGYSLSQSFPTNFSSLSIDGSGRVDAGKLAGQTVSASGTVTFPNATLASTTNITGGTITTVTNLTNDPAGVTTLLGRITTTRAGYLDNLTRLDVAVSGRMASFTLPTNFSLMVINGLGYVVSSRVDDSSSIVPGSDSFPTLEEITNAVLGVTVKPGNITVEQNEIFEG
jgi:hypothetical protein